MYVCTVYCSSDSLFIFCFTRHASFGHSHLNKEVNMKVSIVGVAFVSLQIHGV